MWTESVPKVALLGLDKVSIMVSLSSSSKSSTISVIVIVPFISPGLIASVPLVRV